MKHRPRVDRLLLGLHGLALLRGWPFGDPAEAAARIADIREVAAGPGNETIEIDDPGMRAAYAVWSENYDEVPNALIDAEEPVLRALLAAIEPGRAIDAACGTGRVSSILADLGHDVLAVDPSPEMLDRARDRRNGAAFIRGELDSLPVRSGSADLVVCALALTHVADLNAAIGELSRVAKPGGRVLLSDVHPVAVAMGAQAMFVRRDGSRMVAHNQIHWPSAYLDAFSSADLRVERAVEPPVDEAFVAAISHPQIHAAAGASLLGLPLALIWSLRKDA